MRINLFLMDGPWLRSIIKVTIEMNQTRPSSMELSHLNIEFIFQLQHDTSVNF